MSKLTRALLALTICICILMSGSFRPFYTYAALTEDEYGDIEDYETEQADDSDDLEAQYSDEINQINNRLKTLEEESKKIQANINATLGEKDKAMAQVNAIGTQISITQEQIASLMSRIQLYEKDIAITQDRIVKKNEDIDRKQGEIDVSYEVLRQRLRASYMQDSSTTLGLILGAHSFADFLTRIEYMQRIAQHDRDLMAKLTDQRQGLEVQRLSLEGEMEALEAYKLSVEADKQETEEKKQILGTQINKAQSTVQNLQDMESAYKADLANNKKIQDAAKSELDRIYREIEWSKQKMTSGPMAWPIPAYTIPGKGYVSCEVGPRFGGTDNHTGMDISGSGILGSNIVAVNDGTIVKANWAYSKGVGYGIYVMIDHGVNDKGQSVSTLYAHMSNISVQEGQVVKRGQVIGQVGSTGWSTGPHLHFEVRLNGSWVNPRPYLFG